MLTSVSRNRGSFLIGGCCRGLSSCAACPNNSNRPRLLRSSILAFREWDSQRLTSSTSSISTSSPPTTSSPGNSSSGARSASSNGRGSRRDFLEARQISLYELFDGNAFQLDIPDYQRPYAWKAKQVHELLCDLQQAYTLGQEHFLGAIVTTRNRPGEPYWVIDGQQRLTTLVMLLSYLKAWADQQPGLASLAERAQHMLFIPADPLNPLSQPRYRLLLRSCDQAFFEENFISSFLPVRYHLSTQLDGPANAAGDYHEALARHKQQLQQLQGGNGSGGGSSSSGSGSRPLSNETWWRLYCAGDVMAAYLAAAIEGGLSLPDFMAHVLKSCVVVFLTARDESSCFKIFSSLNGRGVDLAVADKLKPELMRELPPSQRQAFADRWAALESALGRPSFHALFDHYITVQVAARAIERDGLPPPLRQQQQQALQRAAGNTSSNTSSSSGGSNGAGGDPGRPAATGLIPAGSSLLAASDSSSSGSSSEVGGGQAVQRGAVGWQVQHQHLQAARGDVLTYFSELESVAPALERVLEYGQRLLEIRANDWSQLAAEGGSAPAIAADLEDSCFFINLLADTTWQPWALEFFAQSADDAKRAAFLRGAELLQLYCELRQDPAFKQERWLRVGYQLLQRPFYYDTVLQALALTPDECDEFLKLLDSRELSAVADERLLVHLLLRADAINRKHLDWRRLRVEKVMPSHPPDKSQWRRLRLLLPALSEEEEAAATAVQSSSGSSQFNPVRSRGGSGGSRSGSNGNRSGSRSSRGRTMSVDDSTTAASSNVSSVDSTTSTSSSSGSNGSGSSSSSVPRGKREVRYWHEITRSHWHNRLGNLVLLQPSGHESAKSDHLNADLAVKLQHYVACAGDEHFPLFTGGLVGGRYSRDRFSPEECRQRHADIISRIMAVFGLFSGGL